MSQIPKIYLDLELSSERLLAQSWYSNSLKRPENCIEILEILGKYDVDSLDSQTCNLFRFVPRLLGFKYVLVPPHGDHGNSSGFFPAKIPHGKFPALDQEIADLHQEVEELRRGV